jgi:hypothetical protein
MSQSVAARGERPSDDIQIPASASGKNSVRLDYAGTTELEILLFLSPSIGDMFSPSMLNTRFVSVTSLKAEIQ